MGMRSMGSFSLTFGLVTVPVKAYLAARSEQASFNALHAECGGRVKQKLHCPTCKVDVEGDDTIKGYEYAKGQYVHFTKDELKALESDGKGTAKISEFVPADSLGIIQTEKCYYLGPDKGGAPAYALLTAALRQTGRIAIAQWVNRGKEHLVAVRAHGDGLLMQQVYYAAEVRDQGELPLPDEQPDQANLDMAVTLVEQYSSDALDAATYTDRYNARVAEAVEKKVAGEEVQTAPQPAGDGTVVDLFDALQQSLSEQRQAKSGPKKASGGKSSGGPKKAAASKSKGGSRRKSTRKKKTG